MAANEQGNKGEKSENEELGYCGVSRVKALGYGTAYSDRVVAVA